MIISIDGPAGSGKSTVASKLANKLNFIHFNSGKLYRAVTAHFLLTDYDLKDIENEKQIKPLNLKIKYINGIQHVFVNGIDYTAHLTENAVSVNSPYVSKNPYIRSVIDVCQREFVNSHNVVIDGRDIGSYVFPNADIKFYLECDVKERANRRFLELGKIVSYNQILKEIEERDIIDKSKKVAPLRIPDGAIIIDSTNLNIDQVVDRMYMQVKKLKPRL